MERSDAMRVSQVNHKGFLACRKERKWGAQAVPLADSWLSKNLPVRHLEVSRKPQMWSLPYRRASLPEPAGM